MDGLSKVYRAGEHAVEALDEIDLEIREGEFVSLLGPSGCGKSTLLLIAAGLVQPSKGEILVADQVPEPGPNVGIMFQSALLFPWRNVLANVLLAGELLGLDPSYAQSRAHDLLELVGLRGWGTRHPWELSGGMQQRVALARVLLPDPGILLLDEPFGALDEMTREALDLELMSLVEDSCKTVILVTHSVYEAVLVSDRIVVLTPRPGRIAGMVDIDFQRPRALALSGTQEFAAKVAEVRALFDREPGSAGKRGV
jgi:NitT/TauT family transport system ATP-binding protein